MPAMHELSVCYGILRQLEDIAREHQASAVASLRLQIGPLAGIEPQLLAQAFPLASAGTVAADAALQLETLPVRVRCKHCGAETEATANRLLCGRCGDWQTQLLSGDEMLLASVELVTESETEEPCDV
jgi:hydrogenase nickel incorporation protein HypA/HybF